ncbi:HigA family addiction module antitoxin [Roseococcus pinisoli]|uniref:HigA family addiction module antidote protein n=1 Tax=Roseococcus pinisoli TaxID=2835040 RepID=A0ABS5QEM8_9PROT|nr:HigA family addiction module antitoxin [Roseococcus pinisoli]MBS7811751.1 HigA family addiction module antidote protein [Roseococcus pinisoli]
MSLDTSRYPITPEQQRVLLATAYEGGAAGRIDEVLQAICRARGLSPALATTPPQRPAFDTLARRAATRALRTPGDVLLRLFMEPHGLSGKRLAAELGVPRSRIAAILGGSRSITAPTAILLGRRFDNKPEFWLQLQMQHDLTMARRERQTPPAMMLIGRSAIRPPAPPVG